MKERLTESPDQRIRTGRPGVAMPIRRGRLIRQSHGFGGSSLNFQDLRATHTPGPGAGSRKVPRRLRKGHTTTRPALSGSSGFGSTSAKRFENSTESVRPIWTHNLL